MTIVISCLYSPAVRHLVFISFPSHHVASQPVYSTKRPAAIAFATVLLQIADQHHRRVRTWS